MPPFRTSSAPTRKRSAVAAADDEGSHAI